MSEQQKYDVYLDTAANLLTYADQHTEQVTQFLHDNPNLDPEVMVLVEVQCDSIRKLVHALVKKMEEEVTVHEQLTIIREFIETLKK